MAEEQRCGEGHRLCANNCGFFGSRATLGLCSKCYRDYRLKEDQASSAKIAVEMSLQPPPSSSSSSSPAVVSPSVVVTEPSIGLESVNARAAEKGKEAAHEPAPSPAQQPNRCASCRKRVGLTGFRCRCGPTFCGAHRYPEHHGCTFDFKATGREAIAKANPVVKADKLGNKI